MWHRNQLLAETLGGLVASEDLDLLSHFSTESNMQRTLGSTLTPSMAVSSYQAITHPDTTEISWQDLVIAWRTHSPMCFCPVSKMSSSE